MNPELFAVENLHRNKTRDMVVYVLSQEWPLSANKIYSYIKKNKNGKGISYQAVHKIIQSLEESGLLEKTGKNYRISEEWMENTERFISVMKEKYSKPENELNIPEGQTTFHTMAEVDVFLADFAETIMKKVDNEKIVLCLHWKHFWIPLFLEKRVYKRLNGFMKNVKYYGVVSSDTPVDRWCHEFWNKNKVNTRYGVGNSGISDYMTIGDFIIQIFYPDDVMKELDKIFSSANSIHEINIKKLFETVFERKTSILALITRNPVLSEQLRNKILHHFKD